MARSYTSGLMTGVALSVAAGLLGPLWRPAAQRWGRTLAKTAIKQGLMAFEIGRERLAVMSETVEDMVAEAQVELAAERSHEADSTKPTGRADLA